MRGSELGTSLVAVSLFASVLTSSGRAEARPELELRPLHPRPGDMVWGELKSAETSTEATVELLGYRYRWPRADDGAFRGALAIPIETEPGPVEAHVRVGALVWDVRVPIEGRTFPESRLRVGKKYGRKKQPPALEARLERERAAMHAVYAAPPTPAESWGAPSIPTRRPIKTSVFGTKRTFNGQLKSRHYGLDMRGATGDPVAAIAPGRVVLSGMRFYSGGTLVVDHGGGLFSLYFHLSKRTVEVGAAVEGGERIGAVGASGRVTGPHLHLSLAVRAEPLEGGPVRGLYVDPEPVLEQTTEILTRAQAASAR